MQFSEFLKEFFSEKQIDSSVYESYLIGVLEDNSDDSEKVETLTDIFLSLIEESDVPSTVEMIIEKWKESLKCPKKEEIAEKTTKKEVNLAEIMKLKETQISAEGQSNSRKLTEEERRIKQQILANYSQTPIKSEEIDDESEECEESDDDPDLEKNTNKADVNRLAREKREQAKLESQQKKQKDKEDRAKQKAAKDDKKSKRQAAATKGERRR